MSIRTISNKAFISLLAEVTPMSDTDSMSDVTDDSIEQANTPVSGLYNNNRKHYNCILIGEEPRPAPVKGNSVY